MAGTVNITGPDGDHRIEATTVEISRAGTLVTPSNSSLNKSRDTQFFPHATTNKVSIGQGVDVVKK